MAAAHPRSRADIWADVNLRTDAEPSARKGQLELTFWVHMPLFILLKQVTLELHLEQLLNQAPS